MLTACPIGRVSAVAPRKTGRVAGGPGLEEPLAGHQAGADRRLGDRVDEVQAALVHPAQDLVQGVAGLVGMAILVLEPGLALAAGPDPGEVGVERSAGEPGPAE